MRSAARVAALLFFLSACGAANICAADLADCSGVVVDENGVPLASSKITLQSGGGQTFRAETDGAGRFVVRNLPVGDYQIEARREGFFVLSGKTVTLRSGSNDVTLTLKHAEELHEEVQVSATANQIDTQDTAQKDSLTAQEIRDIPVPNSHLLQESLTALPEVARRYNQPDSRHRYPAWRAAGKLVPAVYVFGSDQARALLVFRRHQPAAHFCSSQRITG